MKDTASVNKVEKPRKIPNVKPRPPRVYMSVTVHANTNTHTHKENKTRGRNYLVRSKNVVRLDEKPTLIF